MLLLFENRDSVGDHEWLAWCFPVNRHKPNFVQRILTEFKHLFLTSLCSKGIGLNFAISWLRFLTAMLQTETHPMCHRLSKRAPCILSKINRHILGEMLCSLAVGYLVMLCIYTLITFYSHRRLSLNIKIWKSTTFIGTRFRIIIWTRLSTR